MHACPYGHMLIEIRFWCFSSAVHSFVMCICIWSTVRGVEGQHPADGPDTATSITFMHGARLGTHLQYAKRLGALSLSHGGWANNCHGAVSLFRRLHTPTSRYTQLPSCVPRHAVPNLSF